MERKIVVIDDFNGRKIVFIHDIIFKKKHYVEWMDVKEYLKKYVGEVYKVLPAEEEIYIGAYAAVLAVLELDNDLGLIALDEEGKKQFWEQNLRRRERASRRKSINHIED